jgi:hypothetical protein
VPDEGMIKKLTAKRPSDRNFHDRDNRKIRTQDEM